MEVELETLANKGGGLQYRAWKGSGAWHRNLWDDLRASFWNKKCGAPELTREYNNPIITSSPGACGRWQRGMRGERSKKAVQWTYIGRDTCAHSSEETKIGGVGKHSSSTGHIVQHFVLLMGHRGPGLHKNRRWLLLWFGGSEVLLFRKRGPVHLWTSRLSLRGKQQSCVLSSLEHHAFQGNGLCNCKHSSKVANPPRVAAPI